ncbi:MAG TPA: FAD-binding oxidoreductase [Devosiaceae bacterium]|nr:FAD-binding oxidoreductase [Devosiaceae bacterium]
MTVLSGWGRYPRFPTQVVEPIDYRAARLLTPLHAGLIARGAGRAYGDAAIGEQVTLSTAQFDRIRSFDARTGLMRAEAGVVLADIIDVAMARGHFPPVVPGTQFVTVGGMIAADVHGKNHHRDGGFGDHVEEITLLLPDGSTVHCTAHQNAGLLAATIGGMGLTGTILDATFRLRPIECGWMRQMTLVAPNVGAALDMLHQHRDASYSVAWIDCLARGPALGRSLIFTAEHASRGEVQALGLDPFPARARARLSLPIDCPQMLLSRVSVALFNEVYFRVGAGKAGVPQMVPWESYFFPLDGIGMWNRIYGREGFLQYQCVVPPSAARETLSGVLDRLSRFGSASFLSVLKQLGAAHGDLSFPMDGYTLALDLPLRNGVFELLDELDKLVVAAGGRLYLAKDARQSRMTFERTYPGLEHFRALRRTIPGSERVGSRLSLRLGI